MAWLTSLLKKPAVPEPVVQDLAPEPAPPSGPGLAVLVPDTAGISSFRLTMLPDSAIASAAIAELRADIRHETHAFWALHDKPIVEDGYHVEALVLIRAHPGSDLVYVVSFLDLESALSFTRFEVRRGLHLGNVMIYWAAFAQLREELDGVTILPQFAPPTEYYAPPVPTRDHEQEPQIVAQQAVAEPPIEEPVVEVEQEPEVDWPPEHQQQREDAKRAIDEYLRREEKPKRRIIEPLREPVAFEPPPVVEEPPVVHAQATPPIAEPVAEVEFATAEDDDDLGPLWPEATPRVSAASPMVEEARLAEPPAIVEPELSSPVAEEQAAIQEAFVFQHKTLPELVEEAPEPTAPPEHHLTRMEKAGADNGMLVDETLTTFARSDALVERMAARLSMGQLATPSIGDPEPGVETIPGDEELDFAALNSDDPAAGLTPTPKIDDFDIAYEVERLLRGRKWEQRNGPFSGFQSPPGRF